MGLRGLLLLLLALVGVSARPQGEVESGTGVTTLAVETVTEALDTSTETKPSAPEVLEANPTIASETVTPGTTIGDIESETSFSGNTIEDSENATPSSGTTKGDNENATPASETTTENATPSSGTTIEDIEIATPASGTTTGDSESSTFNPGVTIKDSENATPASETTRAPTVQITVTEESVMTEDDSFKPTEENDLPAEEINIPAVENVTPADATTTVEALEEVTTATLPATETTPAPVVDVVVTESSETTLAPEISAEDLENILSLVAEEIVSEEIVAEEIVAEDIVAEEIEEIVEAILTEEVIEGVAEKIAEDIVKAVSDAEIAMAIAVQEIANEIVEEELADILVPDKEPMQEPGLNVIAKDRTPKAKTEDIENILAIIDELPATSPEVTKENVIRDIVRPVVVEEVKQIKLRITIQPGDSAVFMKGTVLGMSCDAYSEIDNKVEFSWTKNGRFIDTTTGHVFYESQKNGNIIIYSAGPEDEGLYQCVASNSEGVVFSKVSKVRQRKSQSRSRGRESSSRSLAGPPSPSLSGVWVVQPQPEFLEAVSDEKLMVVMSESVPSV